MKSRAAVFVGKDQQLAVDEIEVPAPRADQVIVRLSFTGLCHSQLHQMAAGERLDTPSILGHEAAGHVTHVGSGVKDLKEGDTILKYGHDIGKVVKAIKKGEHVHVHNVKTKKW